MTIRAHIESRMAALRKEREVAAAALTPARYPSEEPS
jgi:hypothetical protein